MICYAIGCSLFLLVVLLQARFIILTVLKLSGMHLYKYVFDLCITLKPRIPSPHSIFSTKLVLVNKYVPWLYIIPQSRSSHTVAVKKTFCCICVCLAFKKWNAIAPLIIIIIWGKRADSKAD